MCSISPFGEEPKTAGIFGTRTGEFDKMGPKKKRLFIPLLLLALAVAVITDYVLCFFAVTARDVTLSVPVEKAGAGFRIVQLCDLHGRSFGKNNSYLKEKVISADPDVIFMTGDMVSEDGGYETAVRLVADLAKIAPVYYSLGNHETDLVHSKAELFAAIEDAGGTVLEKDFVDTEICGSPVRIGGVSGYALGVSFWENSYDKDTTEYVDSEEFSEQRFLCDFENTDRLKLLLCHRPEGATLWNGGDWYDIDFVFSGHLHGGLVRLPFIGGLYAPEEGFFPKYDRGLYSVGSTHTYVSSGLAGHGGILRFNNLPETVSFSVIPDGKK